MVCCYTENLRVYPTCERENETGIRGERAITVRSNSRYTFFEF